MRCPNHDKDSVLASVSIGYCGSCISRNPRLIEKAVVAHRETRTRAGLVPEVPSNGQVVCPDCGNHCKMTEDDTGFCHLREVVDSEVVRKYSDEAPVTWYFDPLPTNCVADWICPVRGRCGFGMNSLAVFYGSCNSDCLFCQNQSYRRMMKLGEPLSSPEQLADKADSRTACICFFGGDPSCNPQHSLKTAQLLLEKGDIAVCYESNGNISGKHLQNIADIVRGSGGTIKIDLKAMTPSLYTALTGVSNTTVIRNFRRLAQIGRDREGEFLVASILLIPGYIGASEVRKLTEFIASLDETIPTALLGFMPHLHMRDLPRTNKKHADIALCVAKDSGLTNVRIGNRALLSNAKYAYD